MIECLLCDVCCVLHTAQAVVWWMQEMEDMDLEILVYITKP
jgi:hypothetical protein